jgi:hypothetical protein
LRESAELGLREPKKLGVKSNGKLVLEKTETALNANNKVIDFFSDSFGDVKATNKFKKAKKKEKVD